MVCYSERDGLLLRHQLNGLVFHDEEEFFDVIEVDLHLHTTFSDGTLCPTELVSLCAERGLKIISISDHDSTEGLEEAFQAAHTYPELTVVPGIELSTDIPGSEIHILGYFVDYRSADFQKVLEAFRSGRESRASSMVERLNALGIDIEWNRVQDISGGGAIGRPHIAQAMVEKEYVKYPREAFDRFIGKNGPAYVERMKLTPVDAISMLLDNGALPVIAHPTYSVAKSDRGAVSDLRDILNDLKKAGLVGMEVFYSDYTPEQVKYLESLSIELELIPCGGSDYHASGNPDEPEPGSVGPPMETFDRLMELKSS